MKSPAFQFYPKDWLSSSKISQMTPEEEGAYVRLLCYCWDSEDCSLPDDDKVLASLSRLGDRWNMCSTHVRQCFTKHPFLDGQITNTRLLQERKKQADRKKQCQKAGIKSGKSRRYKNEHTFNTRSTSVEQNTNSSSSSATTYKKTKQSTVLTKKSTQMPSDFVPTDEHYDLGDELDVNVDTQFEQFKDWAESKGTVYKNWNAAFRNWLRRSKNFTKQNGGNYERKKSNSEIFFEACGGVLKKGLDRNSFSPSLGYLRPEMDE
jgi:uncharacterized protein YdaU (DUF1376 family)